MVASLKTGYVSQVVAALLLALAAVVVAVVAALAGSGRLRRNSVAGIRIPSLYASEAAWRTGHRAAVLPTVTAAVICVVLAIVVLIDSNLAFVGPILETAILVIGVLAGTALASRAARTQAR